jgi:GMP reductase
MKDIKFDFDDVLIEGVLTPISSRSEIINTYSDDMLPIIAAPMDTVVSSDNCVKFLQQGIGVCLPRGEKSEHDFVFESYSLKEIRTELNELSPKGSYLIDVANGHMTELISTTETIKEMYPSIRLMVGNIANPEVYKLLSEAGADYIRVGIGNGGGCLTTQQLGVGYPMASLVKECYEVALTLDNPAKIVADGGMQKYSDIIKALALGADYVMLGSILNKAIESSGDNYVFKHIKVSDKIAKFLFDKKYTKIYKKFRGMSTKEVQKKWGKPILKTSEGVTRIREVEYTLEGWTKNFGDYLKSAMSYTAARSLKDFIGEVKLNPITMNAFNRFKK